MRWLKQTANSFGHANGASPRQARQASLTGIFLIHVKISGCSISPSAGGRHCGNQSSANCTDTFEFALPQRALLRLAPYSSSKQVDERSSSAAVIGPGRVLVTVEVLEKQP
ncbi:MAG: hypothetical protein ABI561_11180 [Bradyrhizobium sp.]